MGITGVKVGVNLLTCSEQSHPLHLRATQYAVWSLLDSDIEEFDWQLQVVDNGSTCQGTLDFLDALAAQNSRVFVAALEENVGIGCGRNVAYRELHDRFGPDLVVDVHTDHVFPRIWLRPVLEALNEGRYARVGIMGTGILTSQGYWYSPRCEATYDWDYEQFRGQVQRMAEMHRAMGSRRIEQGLSHPAIKRWQMLDQIGLYDEQMPGRQNFEDTEEAFRAHQAGWLVTVNLRSFVYHHYHLTRLELSDHPADYNANYGYVLNKHGNDQWLAWQRLLGTWQERIYRR